MAAEMDVREVPMQNPTIVEETAPKKKKLTNEERLEIENIFLKVQNLVLQTKQLQQDVQTSVQMRLTEQQKMKELQERLGKKYGIADMTKVKIHPDGTIEE